MESRKGQLLIASGRLLDPNFARSVVLIVQHDEDGVLGVILNRPLDMTVAEACGPMVEAAGDVEVPINQGGPCPGPLMVLHGNENAGGDKISDGIWFTAEREPIEQIMLAGTRPAKYFANYSGWGLEQLDREITEGSWIITPATPLDVFQADPETQWNKLTARLTAGGYINPDHIPDDPSLN
ncbi:MAG TPA: YqgE/AlgH family protein [Tepidisphaeraceae bacterium]|nr:YqgE/AlgH family protein [Tepidisphaeraceae bacterium]